MKARGSAGLVAMLVVIGSALPGLARQDGEPRLRFDHLTVENSLSHSWVFTIVTDCRGFLWFGTVNGLDRFDGADRLIIHGSMSNDFKVSR